MQDEIIAHGVELMLYGMGTVVVFLALLVVATAAMSRLLARHFPEADPVPAAPPRSAAGTAGPGEDTQLVAAIAAAIHRHRAQRRADSSRVNRP